MTRRAVAVIFVLIVGVAAGSYATASTRTAVPPAAQRLELAATNNPVGARGDTLGLSKVLVPAGAKLALHRHPATQIAYIAAGKLTYSVKSGSVTVMTGPADGDHKVVEKIGPGQTGVISAGQWIVEQPTTIHQAANDTNKPIVIYLATLFPIGSPSAIPVK